MKLSDLEPEGPLIDEIKEIWKNDESYEKFAELNKVLMEDHGTKDDLVRTVIFNRIATLLICLMSALLIFYLYVIDLRSIDGRDLRYLQFICLYVKSSPMLYQIFLVVLFMSWLETYVSLYNNLNSYLQLSERSGLTTIQRALFLPYNS